MKAEAESDDKHKHDEKELEHGEADVPEHQNEDAEGGELLEVGEQVEPGHRQDERPYWPTPTLQKTSKQSTSTTTHNVALATLADVPGHSDVEDEADGEDVDHPVHHVGNREVT